MALNKSHLAAFTSMSYIHVLEIRDEQDHHWQRNKAKWPLKQEDQKHCPPVIRKRRLILTTKDKKTTTTDQLLRPCYFHSPIQLNPKLHHTPQFNSWLYHSAKSEGYSVPFPQHLGGAPHYATVRTGFSDQLKTELWQSSLSTSKLRPES